MINKWRAKRRERISSRKEEQRAKKGNARNLSPIEVVRSVSAPVKVLEKTTKVPLLLKEKENASKSNYHSNDCSEETKKPWRNGLESYDLTKTYSVQHTRRSSISSAYSDLFDEDDDISVALDALQSFDDIKGRQPALGEMPDEILSDEGNDELLLPGIELDSYLSTTEHTNAEEFEVTLDDLSELNTQVICHVHSYKQGDNLEENDYAINEINIVSKRISSSINVDDERLDNKLMHHVEAFQHKDEVQDNKILSEKICLASKEIENLNIISNESNTLLLDDEDESQKLEIIIDTQFEKNSKGNNYEHETIILPDNSYISNDTSDEPLHNLSLSERLYKPFDFDHEFDYEDASIPDSTLYDEVLREEEEIANQSPKAVKKKKSKKSPFNKLRKKNFTFLSKKRH